MNKLNNKGFHILTVNEKTFDIHLKYMFAGTGRNNYPEQMGAKIDISAIRKGDTVVFYVEKVGFFGFFQVSSEPFYEQLDNNYLEIELGRNLTYRFFLKPHDHLNVYKFPKSEWEIIEEPKNIQEHSIFNMQWSWIFKKLNANRGLLTLPQDESINFVRIFIENNEVISNNNFCYDSSIRQIKVSDKGFNYFDNLAVEKIEKYEDKLGKIEREEDLRWLFCNEIGKNTKYGNLISEIVPLNETILYIGNEVVSSFSETRMDLVIHTSDLNNKTKCYLIELKNEFIYNENIYFQVYKYSKWISSYKIFDVIIPILVLRNARLYPLRGGGKYFKYLKKSDCIENKTSPWYREILSNLYIAKDKLIQNKIFKLNEFKVYVFNVENSNELINFEQVV